MGVSEKIFSFRIIITDAQGKAYGPFDATLPISVGPPEFLPPELPQAGVGKEYSFSFCDNPAAMDCLGSSSISGGAGAPYTFSATGLPLGLFLDPNGNLYGKIPQQAQEGEAVFRVCAIDSARIEDCKDVKLSISNSIALQYRLSLKSSLDYEGEVVNFDFCGGSAKEAGLLSWEIDEAITLTQPYPGGYYTSHGYDTQADEYGYTSADNFKSLQVPMKATGRASTSHDFCGRGPIECRADSFSGSYVLSVPIEMRLDESGLSVYIDNAYVRDNPLIETEDLSQMTCDQAGAAQYILKKMAIESPFVLENGYKKVVLDANGGELSGQYEDMNPYAYAFGAASGRISRHLAWTLAVERIG